jgi:tetratricopeptide (TPR) repeat protein
MQNDLDHELQNYFTDVEHLREWFKNAIAAPALPKHLLIVHGVGGVGKSSLLRMFRLHCKSVGVPVALTSGDEQKSALDVLTRWADDLKTDSIALPEFGKTHEHYRAIQAKVDTQAKKAQDARGRAADIAGKAASKTAEAVGGALAGAAIGSVIPGIGTAIGSALGGVLGGMGAEALVDWLRGFLTKPDIDLLLDPAKKLTADFLADLQKVADRRRIVLMLDTFEQMTALEDWAREMAQQLPANVLLVIAGRALPNWSRAWAGWMASAQVEELKPMNEDDMRELVRRYYAMLRGGEPDPKQVEAIIRFARGLPMVVTSAVQLWVKYGVEDFQAVKPEIVANLVDRLMEGVPKAMVPALEAAAIVRWFDQPILRAVMAQEDVREVYNELRRFPFVRTRTEGLALHDAVREIMDENLRVQDAERHRELHERAAAYFEKRLEKATGEDAERLGLERLYHRIRADEETGIQLFQEMAEELVRYRLVNRLRALLNDVNTYPLERENSRLWRDYYMACLLDQEGRWLPAEELFESIAQNPNASNQVQSYALGRWGTYLARPERISRPGGVEKAIKVLQASLEKLARYDFTTAYFAFELGLVYERLCQWDKAWEYFNKFEQFASSLGKSYQTAYMKSSLKDPYAKTGNWRKLLTLHQEVVNLLEELPNSSDIRSSILHTWSVALVAMGRYAEAEQIFRDGLEYWARLGTDTSYFHRYVGYSVGLQDRFEEAHSEFQKAMDESKKWVALRDNFDLDRATLLHYSFWAFVHLRAGELDLARRKFLCALWLKRRHKDYIGLPELFVGLGIVYELHSNYIAATQWYARCLRLKWTSRCHHECAALTGLIRVKHAQGDYAAIPPLLAEAEQLAQQYEYNDHLASLRLTQGHIAWEGVGQVSNLSHGFDAALRYYQHALIYALRYNRFLLDEVLSGRPQGTPLRPIIPECLKRGEEGRRMLIALRDWWQTGVNDIGTPRPDTISPIPEGISLLEAERIARQREPGDGSPQESVVERIEAALKDVEAI